MIVDRKIYSLNKNIIMFIKIYGADNITCRVTYYCSFSFERKNRLENE